MVKQRINLKDIDISINGKIIGGAEELTATVTRANEFAMEGGAYKAAEIVDGSITGEGSLTRAFIDVDLLNEVFPNTNLAPEFTLSGTITSGKTPSRDVKLFRVKFDSFDISSLSVEGWAKNVMPFKFIDWDFN